MSVVDYAVADRVARMNAGDAGDAGDAPTGSPLDPAVTTANHLPATFKG
jgi:hypothetical protein